MTNWLPTLDDGAGPLYVRLADRIENDIDTGVLPTGAKLPPQRNLAFDIGVTVGTVGRAYALARERGLVSGEVGRGTYVLDREDVAPGKPPTLPPLLAGTRGLSPPPGKLRLDSTAALEVGQSQAIEDLTRQIVRQHPEAIVNYVHAPSESWQEAGSRWLTAGDWRPSSQSIVPTLGGHAAILAVIAAVTAPGDRVAFERLTYSSIARSTSLIGRRVVAMASDGGGVDPEDFERLCAQQHPKIAFLIPSLQNPTLAIMSEERRRAIVDVARKHNVWLIEDAIYGAMLESQPVTLAALAPERTFHVGSLSKTVAAGLRSGWVSCPPHYAARILTTSKMLTGGKPFLLAELAARLVLSGEADAIRDKVRNELQTREAMARKAFDGCEFTSHPRAPFLWMKLPEPWLSGTFKNAALNENVLIDDEDEYKPVRTGDVHHRVRIAFSVPKSRGELDAGFTTLRNLLEGGSAGYDSYG
ncbi:PLP-dependent aminotransferase family protein [Nitratireductor mangrovi]|uniref:PLP-dependent aminotransferase family protein n=1 Tax=Nitratireductor mangrovi TaxID=2599600 RepID=A0A5B8KVJ8_9HYPH|nr:PLP-dependent aminotransferase family protein [Nitratireductor mangrovi]QDY99562.1 PLP-dependent aminotransferase family protein [Nitratireductor mangrovi]